MLYLLHGPETFLRDEAIAKLEARVGDPAMADLNVIRLQGRSLSVPELIHVCDAIPFLSERRLVIVDGLAGRMSGRSAPKGLLEALTAYLPNLPDSTDLVFIEEELLRSSHKLLKLVEQCGGRTKAFAQLKGRALENWVGRWTKAHGCRIEPRAVHELTTYVGNNLRLLAIELQKLGTYVGAEGVIRVQDVQKLVSYVREESIFDLVDALGQRNGAKAIKLFHQLLDEGKEALFVFAMIVRQFRMIMQAKSLSAQHAPLPQVMKAMGIRHRFIVDKMMQQASNFELARLQAIYHDLQRIDVQIKTGQIEAELALDVFMVQVCSVKQPA